MCECVCVRARSCVMKIYLQRVNTSGLEIWVILFVPAPRNPRLTRVHNFKLHCKILYVNGVWLKLHRGISSSPAVNHGPETRLINIYIEHTFIYIIIIL